MINLKLLKGNSSTSPTAAGYTGPAGEVLVDTDTNCLRVQDGVTAGGHPICPATSGVSFALDPVTTGTSHTVTLTSAQELTYWTSSTAGAKTTTLPGAASGNKGWLWIIKTTLNNGDTHSVVPLSGTIDSFGTLTFNDFRTAVSLISDGSSNWMVV